MRTLDPSVTFGNVAVVTVGDFFQLPPVMARSLHTAPTSMAVRLWEEFEKHVLREIVRQRGDREFIDVLNVLRVHEKYAPLPDAVERLLRTRLITTGKRSS